METRPLFLWNVTNELIDKYDTNSLKLKFEVEAVMMRGTFTDIGKIIFLSVMRALAKIIRKVLQLRLEVPVHDPFGIGLAYARADRRACHLWTFTFGIEILDGRQDTLIVPSKLMLL